LNTSTLNLSISLKPSKILAIVIVATHFLAAICVVFIAIAVWLKLILLLCIAALLKSALTQYVWLNAKNSVIKINTASSSSLTSFPSSGQFLIQTKANKRYQASVINAAWVFDYFAILVFKINVNERNKKVLRVVIAKDMISQEQLYALRLAIQYAAAGQ